MRRTAEFDAFGPWVDEVSDAEGVPPLYRDHPLDLASAHLVLKVPRKVARRDANPDMDLYDHLVIAGPRSVTILSRLLRDRGYSTHEVPYDRVASIESSVSLLDGRFAVHDVQSATPAVAFTYNSVSQEVVARLTRVVREQALSSTERSVGTSGGGTPAGRLGLHDLGDDDVALVTAQRELAAHEPDLALLGVHSRAPVRRVNSGAMSTVVGLLWPTTLHAAVVCERPGELHLLHRRTWVTTGRRPAHSVAHTVVVVPRVTKLTARDAEAYEGVRVVSVVSGESVRRFAFPRDSDSEAAVHRVLGGVAGR